MGSQDCSTENSRCHIERDNFTYIVTMLARILPLLASCYILGARASLEQLCQQINFFDKFNILPECLAYGAYGCWCGPGGSGTPVDGTDRCCQLHDFCYDKIIASNLCSPYRVTYEYSEGKCVGPPGCATETCKCDNLIAQCFSKNEFIKKHWGWRWWHTCK